MRASLVHINTIWESLINKKNDFFVIQLWQTFEEGHIVQWLKQCDYNNQDTTILNKSVYNKEDIISLDNSWNNDNLCHTPHLT